MSIMMTHNKYILTEGDSGFYLLNPSGKEICIGDGVDMFTDFESQEHIMAGTPRFYGELARWFFTSTPEELNEYFDIHQRVT